MKFSEMDTRQQKAFLNIKYAACDLIGGLENNMSDYPEDSQEYKGSAEALADHEYLVSEIYREATTNVYGPGSVFTGSGAQSIIKDIRFCGKEWLMERVEKRVRKEGY